MRLIALTFIGLCLLGCGPSSADDERPRDQGTVVNAGVKRSNELKAKRIGPLYLTMSEKELVALGLPITWKSYRFEDTPYRVAEIGTEHGVVTASIDRSGIINSLSTREFQTPEGARVGMTISELEKIYPKGTRFFGEEDGGYLTFDTKSNSGFFRFHADRVPDRCFSNVEYCSQLLSEQRSYEYYVQ